MGEHFNESLVNVIGRSILIEWLPIKEDCCLVKMSDNIPYKEDCWLVKMSDNIPLYSLDL